MRKPVISGLFFLAVVGTAQAAEPLGEWRDEEGKATIRIVDCNSRLWGVVASESIPGGVDSKNPDKAKRTRPLLGIPVLLNMKKVEDEKDKWEGKVYNAEDGKTYDASIQLKAPNALRVEGCLVWPLCGGQTWSRVDSSAAPGGAKTGATGSTGAKTAAPAPKSAQPSTQPSPFPTPIGSAPKSSKGSTAGKAPAATAATADPATTEICSLPEIAGAPH